MPLYDAAIHIEAVKALPKVMYPLMHHGNADACAVTHLDGAVGFAGLPVPEPQLALTVTAQHIAPIWREGGLAGIPCHCVPLHGSCSCQHKQRQVK